MATGKSKRKGGKAAKSKKQIKRAPRRAQNSTAAAPAPAAAPVATAQAAPEPTASVPVIVPSVTVAMVAKGAERIPVVLRGQAHLDELRAEHGADNIEVQS